LTIPSSNVSRIEDFAFSSEIDRGDGAVNDIVDISEIAMHHTAVEDLYCMIAGDFIKGVPNAFKKLMG
jgi:hypothetical protein